VEFKEFASGRETVSSKDFYDMVRWVLHNELKRLLPKLREHVAEEIAWTTRRF
jgi:hypothetical protein